MKSKLWMLMLAGVALAGATPALAQRGHGPPAGGPPGLGGGMSLPGGIGDTVRGQARMGSEAAERAADRARERADANSAIFADADVRADRNRGVTVRTRARQHSQGAAHANARALARANANSALNTSTTTTTTVRRPSFRNPEPQANSRRVRSQPSYGSQMRAYARRHSQGRFHASARAHARANANSSINATITTTKPPRR